MIPLTRTRFADRREAGQALAESLSALADEDPVIVALPRGGVPVGYELARALGAPLDIGLVRKLGAPMQPELGIGALGETGETVINEETVRALGISRQQIERVIERESAELERRRERYRSGHPPVEVANKTVIVADDGIATGVTAAAAAQVLRARGARRVVLAVPVCPRDAERRLRPEFDHFICLISPEPFFGVGGGYRDFKQTSDEEVIELLEMARSEAGTGGHDPEPDPAPSWSVEDRDVWIEPSAGISLEGSLRTPSRPVGLVIFAHGSGSGRSSPRNRSVAAALNDAGLATLLFDLLTEAEAADRGKVFDIGLLGERLLTARRWADGEPGLAGLPVGLFGASTGAAAALRAAAALGDEVAAVVSRGGRPDLAGDALAAVRCPVLLIVGGQDRGVLELNRGAAELLGGPHELTVVPGAGHVFEEPGALEQVASLAADWFSSRLAPGRR